MCLLCALIANAHDFEVDSIFYSINPDGTTVTVTQEQSDSYTYYITYHDDVVIPSEVYYNGKTYTVVSIGEHAFMGCDNLIRVTMPNTITSIGNDAFHGCSSLIAVDMSNSSLPLDGWHLIIVQA